MKKRLGIILLAITMTAQTFAACAEDPTGAGATYSVTIGNAENGTIVADKTSVEAGGEVTFTVTPNENYIVKEFSVNEYPVTLYEGAYTEYGVMENLAATASFEYALVNVSFVTGTDEAFADKTVTLRQSYGTLPTPTAEEGEIFRGWYTEANGGGSLIKASSRVQVSGSQTLYAYFVRPSADLTDIDAEDYTPYSLTVTYYDSKATRLGLTYHTEELCEYPVVQYAEGEISDFASASGVQTITCDTERSTINDYRYTAALPVLKAQTQYSVRVGDKATGIYGETHTFTTKAEVSTDINFMFVSDTQEDPLDSMSGKNVTYWSRVMEEGTKFFPASETNFIAHGGDLVNYGSEKAYWSEMLGSVEQYLFDMPLVETPGNHEESWTYGGGNYNIMRNMYNIDLPAQDTSNGYYYSFDMGALHFVVLNTNEAVAFNYNYGENGSGKIYAGGKAEEGIPDIAMSAGRLFSEQINWVKSDLKKAKNSTETKWTIVMMHEGLAIPTFTTNLSIQHAFVLRQQLMQTFDDNDVDLVLNGHNHYIQTSNPLGYDAAGEIKIRTVDDGSANGDIQLYERLFKIVDSSYTVNTSVEGYEGVELVDFGSDYISGTGTIFHQIATTGMQYNATFKESALQDNLTKYNNIYNNLRSGGAGAVLNSSKAYSMFSYIEIKGDQLVLRNYGVNVQTTYSPTGEQLQYFGGFVVRK